MQPSNQVIAFIKARESFSARPYLDPAGNKQGRKSIGWGHSIQPGEAYLLTAILTPAQGDALFNKDLGIVVNAANHLLSRPMSQLQFDACLDIGYNAGTGAMATVITMWNRGASAADTAGYIRKKATTVTLSPGVHVVDKDLVNRRDHEAGWFENSKDIAISLATATMAGTVNLVEKKSPYYSKLLSAA